MTNAMDARSIVVLSGGVSDPSSTRLLADRLAQKSLELLAALEVPATATVVELGPLATDIALATVGAPRSEKLDHAIDRIATADAVIAATPIYKAGVSGLFKSFIDLLDNDLLIAKPVILAGTAGSARHALVVEDQLRPLFAFMRALTLPTSVMATPDDWASRELGTRIARAAGELAQSVRVGLADAIADATWGDHRHEFGGRAARAAGEVDLGTTLMRLAAGGSLVPASEDAPRL